MKVYQSKYQKILVNEAAVNEEQFITQYNEFFEEFLRYRNISKMNIYQVIDLSNFSISSNAVVIERLLKKRILPPFRFLTCRN